MILPWVQAAGMGGRGEAGSPTALKVTLGGIDRAATNSNRSPTQVKCERQSLEVR